MYVCNVMVMYGNVMYVCMCMFGLSGLLIACIFLLFLVPLLRSPGQKSADATQDLSATRYVAMKAGPMKLPAFREPARSHGPGPKERSTLHRSSV